MERVLKKNQYLVLAICLLCAGASGFMIGCSGGSSGDFTDLVAASFNQRFTKLYHEVPIIEVEGNLIERDNPDTALDEAYFEPRHFCSAADMSSELYDSDEDGIKDKLINDFSSCVNSTNRLLHKELAACATVTPDKWLGYDNIMVWEDKWELIPGTVKFKYLFPDTMPATADATGTNGTQFVQLILPFKVDSTTLFDLTQENADQVDYLDTDFLTITDENGTHVPAMVLVNGIDVDGVSHVSDPNWSEMGGIKPSPGEYKSSIIFVARSSAGLKTPVPHFQPFTTWAGGLTELRIHLKKAYDHKNNLIEVDSKWAIILEGSTANRVNSVVETIVATDYIKDGGNNNIEDPENAGAYLVNRGTSFVVTFDKPVIPETVGQSIVFDGPPFNGNTGILPSSLATLPPLPGKNPCVNGVGFDAIATNVSMVASLILSDGTPLNTTGHIPFRCTPLHQNNLSSYILNPIIDLPSSSDLGSPYFTANKISRMLITVRVHFNESNTFTGNSINMGPCGAFQGKLSADAEATFVVESGGRAVNAPVCPNALYYCMGPKGLGVVDLDGNGFTTNDPAFSKECLVTAFAFYNKYGNAGISNGNRYAYAAKAMAGTSGFMGLGKNTPMPGINEGSDGMETVVKDSKGNAQLYPDPYGDQKYSFVADVEIGDFLDSLIYDQTNVWAKKSLHTSSLSGTESSSNLIGTPPTPNPPPLTLPIGMRATHVVIDYNDLSSDGAFVIMGKEVFTVDLTGAMVPPSLTGFVHLKPAYSHTAVDEPFPPNAISGVNFMNLGPVAESSTAPGTFYGSRQQIGNFLFIADRANNTVSVVNSNTMDVITSLTGLNQPDAVAVRSDLTTLYVSNSGGNNVSVINVNPKSETFLKTITTIPVGGKPKGIACQPDGEDIFVCNYGSNSISIINSSTNTVRKTLTVLLKKPWDMVAAPRQFNFGFGTQVFHGYISNFGGNNVLVYESGPDGFGGVGYDDVLGEVPPEGENGQPFSPLLAPKGICWDPLATSKEYTLTGGVYVAHSTGGYGMVSRIAFSAQQAPWGPIFLIPISGAIGGSPGFGKRRFLITGQWGGPGSQLSGHSASDVALLDYNRHAWNNENWAGPAPSYVTNYGDLGQNPISSLPVNNKHPIRIVPINPTVPTYIPALNPDRLFVSFEDTTSIDVLDVNMGLKVNTITGLPYGVKVLKSYFK